MDFRIRQFKNTLIQTLNAVQLPLEIKRLVFREVYDELCAATEELILQEQRAQQQKQEEAKQKITELPIVEKKEAENG